MDKYSLFAYSIRLTPTFEFSNLLKENIKRQMVLNVGAEKTYILNAENGTMRYTLLLR